MSRFAYVADRQRNGRQRPADTGVEQGASGSVGSALRSYAEKRGFEVFHSVRLFCAAQYYIVRFNARARVSSRVSQALSNFISDAR